MPEDRLNEYLELEAEHDPLDPPVIGPAWKCSIGLFLYRNGDFDLDDYIHWLIRTRQRAVLAEVEVESELCESR
jgi:hypothetical protein